MNDDIITPLLLFPDFETLYVMDLLVSSNSMGVLQKDIIETLVSGISDLHRHSHKKGMNLGNMKGKSKILFDETNDNRWVLKFRYRGKDRTLIRYEKDFTQIWPDEINGIDHVVVVGVLSWKNLTMIYKYHIGESGSKFLPDPNGTHIFRNMIIQRVKLPFTWTERAHCSSKKEYDIFINNENNSNYYMIDLSHKDNEITPFTRLTQVLVESFEDDWYDPHKVYIESNSSQNSSD
jgi:hypothetical protein